MSATGADICGGDDTACAMARIEGGYLGATINKVKGRDRGDKRYGQGVSV